MKLARRAKRTAIKDALPEPRSVPLRTKDGIPEDIALFPMHAYSGQLPAMVSMRVGESDKAVILATGWWGTPKTNPEANAVRVSANTLKQLVQEPAGNVEAKVEKAGIWQILRRRRGFFFSLATVLIATASAVTLAVVGVVLDEQPFVWVAIVGLLASVGECARAATDIRGAFSSGGD